MNPEAVETTRRSAAAKLHPSALNTSTFVRSLLAYLVGEKWTYPPIVDIGCTPDGTLYVQESESDGFLRVLTTRRMLIAGLLQIAQLVDLTGRERTYLLDQVPKPRRRRARR